MQQGSLNSNPLRSKRLVYGIFGLVLSGGIAFGGLYLQNTAGVTTTGPSHLPQAILEQADVEKIHTLQNTGRSRCPQSY